MDGRTCYLYGQVAVLGEFGARGTGAGRSTPHRIIMMANRLTLASATCGA